MQTVTQRLKDAIAVPHQVVTRATATLPSGASTALTIASGSVSSDRTQRIRRTATLQVLGGSALFAMLSVPGCSVAVDHGINFGGVDIEWLPQIRGELSSAALPLGDGLIQVSVADQWQRVAAMDYLVAFTPATTAKRVDVIVQAIQDCFPGITIRNTATDAGTVATAQAWTSRADMITGLATDGGLDAYFAPDGAFVLKPLPQPTDGVAWLIKSGPGGTLENLTRTRPLDRVFNTVVIEPGTADSSQTWTQVAVQISDTANPRHPNYIGVRPYRYSAPSLLTQADATAVATALLAKVQGSTETLALGAIAHPGLESGDVVRLGTPIDGGSDIDQHLVDSIQLDLVTGSMSCGTRATTDLPS